MQDYIRKARQRVTNERDLAILKTLRATKARDGQQALDERAAKALKLAALTLGSQVTDRALEEEALRLMQGQDAFLATRIANVQFEKAAGSIPPGLPLDFNPYRQFIDTDPRSPMLSVAIALIHECFPVPRSSWERWGLSKNGGMTQLTVDLGALPPSKDYKGSPKHGFIKMSSAIEATTAMLSIELEDHSVQTTVLGITESLARMALRNSVPTDITGWIFHAWTVWKNLLDSQVYRCKKRQTYPTQSGGARGESVIVLVDDLMEMTLDGRYFRPPTSPGWFTLSEPFLINPDMGDIFVEEP